MWTFKSPLQKEFENFSGSSWTTLYYRNQPQEPLAMIKKHFQMVFSPWFLLFGHLHDKYSGAAFCSVTLILDFYIFLLIIHWKKNLISSVYLMFSCQDDNESYSQTLSYFIAVLTDNIARTELMTQAVLINIFCKRYWSTVGSISSYMLVTWLNSENIPQIL